MRIVLVLLAGMLLTCSSQNPIKQSHSLVFGFYNVENLFDTIDDPHVWDEEFTPGSKKNYTGERYLTKVANLAKVIHGFPDGIPDALGICEVENEGVVKALCKQLVTISGTDFKYVHYDSPDARGIDVALVYNPENLVILDSRTHSVNFQDDPDKKTRDILQVIAVNGSDTFSIFVNHWPSRSGGQAETESKRIDAALVLSSVVTKLNTQHPSYKIIVMGDFNDTPRNKSITSTLKADSLPSQNGHLFNLSHALCANADGSYFYKNHWEMLDQLIISRNLLSNDHWEINGNSQKIVRLDFMLYKTKSGVLAPNRTYSGNYYYGGYSDHLPVYFVMKRK